MGRVIKGFRVGISNSRLVAGTVTYDATIYKFIDGKWEYVETKEMKDGDSMSVVGEEDREAAEAAPVGNPPDIGINVTDGVGVAETIG